MSERDSGADSAGGGGGPGFGGFLLGLAVGAAIGFLFAPEAGTGSRRRLAGKLRELRDLAADKAGQLGELVDEARADAEAVSAARAEVKRRVLDARRRRHAIGAARRGRLTLVGLPLFLWFSTRLFGGLRAALNEVFDTDEIRPWPIAKLIDLTMVFATGAVLVANALVAAYEARNAGVMSGSFALDWFWRFSMETVAFALGVLLFFLIFKILPSRRIQWQTALVAAVFCSLGFEVAKRLYALYVAKFVTFDRVASDANVVALFLFLLWIYYTAYLFLLGGEVAETYDLVRMRRSQRVQLG